jgi:prophage regulatory protein
MKGNEKMNHQIPEMGFLRLKQVLQLFPVGQSTWYAGVKAGKYPAPVRLSERCVAWRAKDIFTLIDVTSRKIEPKTRNRKRGNYVQ